MERFSESCLHLTLISTQSACASQNPHIGPLKPHLLSAAELHQQLLRLSLLFGLKWSFGFLLLRSALGASSRSELLPLRLLFRSLFLWWTSVISRAACVTLNAMAASTLTSSAF